MSTWSSGVGKFVKKDPNHGALGKKMKHTIKKIWNKIKHWCCKVGLCNLDKCSCDCHDKPRGRSKAYFTTIKESRAKKIETKKATPSRFSTMKNLSAKKRMGHQTYMAHKKKLKDQALKD